VRGCGSGCGPSTGSKAGIFALMNELSRASHKIKGIFELVEGNLRFQFLAFRKVESFQSEARRGAIKILPR
jgi:hypothetical protein